MNKIYKLADDYIGTLDKICHNLELAWKEHCRKLLYAEEILTNSHISDIISYRKGVDWNWLNLVGLK